MPRWNTYASFAVFGALWGAWGASVPAIRDQAGVTDGELGTALLFIGVGALPAMLVAGRAVDRWHERATAVLLALLGAVGVLVVLAAHGVAGLAATLVLLGATSGAADVAINTAAGSAQRAHPGPVIARAHATFSAAVVVASLTTGALNAAGLPMVIPFVAVAAAALGIAVAILRAGDDARSRRASRAAAKRAASPLHRAISAPHRAASPPAASPPDRATSAPHRAASPPDRATSAAHRAASRPDRATSPRAAGPRLAPLLLIGGLGALGYAVENAHQSWSALYLRDVVGAGAATAAAGPAVFAGIVAVSRFATGAVSGRRPRLVLVGGAIVAGMGTALIAATSTLAVALAGLALAAAGTAVLFPTLLVVLTARVSDRVRGAATSMVTTVAYLGFLAGPVYVGLWADAVGLPGAMLAVAALAVALATLAATSVRARVPSPQ